MYFQDNFLKNIVFKISQNYIRVSNYKETHELKNEDISWIVDILVNYGKNTQTNMSSVCIA
jgi:hypothetical protein